MKAVDFEKAFDDIDEKILERFFDVNEKFTTKTEPKKKNFVLKFASIAAACIVMVFALLLVTVFNDKTMIDLANCPNGQLTLGNFVILKKSDSDIILQKYTGTDEHEVNVPQGITTISTGAFKDNQNIYKVVLPETVHSIEKEAFFSCSSLSVIILPENEDISIADDAFVDVPYANLPSNDNTSNDNISNNDVNADIPDIDMPYKEEFVISRGELVKYNGNNENVIIPNKVTKIGKKAFADNTDIKSIVIPASVKYFDTTAFDGCINLKHIKILSEYVKELNGGTFKDCAFESAGAIGSGCDFEFAWKNDIPNSAFSSCKSLKYVTIPEGMTRIGHYSFFECSNLEQITLPDSITDICASAFEDCFNLTVSSFPKELLRIGNRAFKNCALNKELIFNDKLCNLGPYSFSGAENLESVWLPATINYLSSRVFAGCPNIISVFYNGSNVEWENVYKESDWLENDSVLQFATVIEKEETPDEPIFKNSFPDLDYFTIDGTTLVGYTGSETTVIIPEGVETVDPYAFFYSRDIVSLTVPKTVKEMSLLRNGENVLPNLQKLIVLSDNIEFYSTVVSEHIKTAGPVGGGYDFEFTMKDTVKSVQFANCKYLETIVLPDCILKIGKEAFKDCISLRNVVIPEGVTLIDYRAFYRCSALETMIIPDTVTDIGDSAFYGCKMLKKVVIPASVKNIGRDVFLICGFTSAGPIGSGADCEFGWTTEIPYNAFRGCRELKTVEWPDSLVRIGGYAFRSTGLTEVLLPDSVTYIGYDAFAACYSLKTIRVPGIPYLNCKYILKENPDIKSIGYIGSGADYEFDWPSVMPAEALRDCTTLEEVIMPNNVISIGDRAFSSCESLKTIKFPQNLQYLGEFVFNSCYQLNNVVLPEGLESIPNGLFSGCRSLSDIYIPESVKTVESYAFSNCAFTELPLSDGIQKIGYYAFAYNNGLESAVLPRSLQVLDEGMFERCTNLKEIVLPENLREIRSHAFFNCNSLTEIKIPDTVSRIGGGAFSNCTSLTSIELPESIEEISGGTFSRCINLTEIKLSKNLKIIGMYTFEDCSAIKSIIIPDSVTEIGLQAFAGCISLENIQLPPGLTEIEYRTFEGCTSLKNVSTDANIKIIGKEAFLNCTSLEHFDFNEGLEEIKDSAFKNCVSLKGLKLKSGLIRIEIRAFEQCVSLETIEIPEGCTTIGFMAFYQASSIKSVFFPKSLISLGDNSFANTPNLSLIIMPEGSIAYKEFRFRIEELNLPIEIVYY